MQLQNKIDKRRSENSLRVLQPNKVGLIDFCSNDYLGFARSTFLAQQADLILKAEFGLNKRDIRLNGSTGSRLLNGNSDFVEALEAQIASFHDGPASLIFNSGYDANLGFYSTVPTRHDLVLFDEYCHASIRDGLRLGEAKAIKFRHNDLTHLVDLLKGERLGLNRLSNTVYIAVESVYSMDGDQAPLAELVDICKQYNAKLVVDEAHATGVLGLQGRGVVFDLGLQNDVFARLFTFGKAIGGHGAAIVGAEVLRSYLINFCRPFIYSTALPPVSLVYIKAAYDYLALQKVNSAGDRLSEQVQLLSLIAHFKANQPQPSSPSAYWVESQSAIQCLVLGDVTQVKMAAQIINEKGFDVKPILSPTVQKGTERLRICLHAFNSVDEVDALLKVLHEIVKQ